jgi:hypothetical protein
MKEFWALHRSKRFLVGDAAQRCVEKGWFDWLDSNNGCEHISLPSVERIVEHFATTLSTQRIDIITPDIVTGICGGHLLERYNTASDQDARVRSEPWEHLRKRRYTANT